MVRNRERAEMLMRKAKNDQVALEKLAADSNSPDDVTGFHAQQAVEKCLKAVLALTGVRYPFTHDLQRLLDLMRESNIPVPNEFEDVKRLTHCAALFRYDDVAVESIALDRPWALDCVRQVRSWAEALLQTQPSS